MAEETREPGQRPNGNGLQLDLHAKKFGLTGPNVALLLLILIIGGVAYLRTGTIDKTLKAGQEQLAGADGRWDARINALFGRLDTLRDDLQDTRSLLAANMTKLIEVLHAQQLHEDEGRQVQTELVHSQTEAIRGLVEKVATTLQDAFQEMRGYVQAWFSEMGRRQETLNWNIANPAKTLPLSATPPRDEGQR
jgi:hypothetical protein